MHPLIQFLCRYPYPRFWRAVGSLLLAFPLACFMIGLADKTQLPEPLMYFLSPGYVIGSLATDHPMSLGAALEVSGWISLSVNLVYWSSIFFGLLSLRARSRDCTEASPK